MLLGSSRQAVGGLIVLWVIRDETRRQRRIRRWLRALNACGVRVEDCPPAIRTAYLGRS